MLYELVAIARCPPANLTLEASALAKKVGRSVLENRGVVRSVQNWGVRPLPRVWNKNRERNIIAAHFYMKFDCSPAAQNEIKRSLRADARVLRATIVRVGESDLKSLINSDISVA